MADNPIGISFIPTAQNQAQGPNNLRNEGGIGSGGTDLAQAYKILSLRLPTVVGAQSPVPQALLTSPGASALPNGMNPQAALFAALLKSMLGVQAPPPASSPSASPSPSDIYGGMQSQSAPADQAPPPPADLGRLVPRIQIPQDQSGLDRGAPSYTAPPETNSWLDSMGIDTKNVY